jgi:hypothetical protein
MYAQLERFWREVVVAQSRYYPGICLDRLSKTTKTYVGFEVLTAVVMKSTVFWDITPCNRLRVIRRFGGTYRLHHQGRRISRAENQREIRGASGGLL